MAGMKFITFPPRGGWLFAVPVAFLAVVLWHAIFRDALSSLGFLLLATVFAIYSLVSFVLALVYRSKTSWLRLGINLVAVAAFFPAVWLGGKIRDQLFLANLSKYQAMVDELIREDQESSEKILRSVPNGFPSMFVPYYERVDRGSDQSVTIFFHTGDSSAVGHSGYVYRSDDNLQKLKESNSRVGFIRLAPKWFEWGS